jgi:hypothetical protein
MPFGAKWIISWSRFFGETAANFSMRITPWATPQLERGLSDQDKSKILIERDLLSAIAVRPWSIHALAKELRPTHGRLLDESPFFKTNEQNVALTNRPPWFTPVREWLTAQAARYGNPPTQPEIDQLAVDPPIPFFVRFEAGLDEKVAGKRLGVLGSIVVADVIYGVLQQDTVLAIDGGEDLRSQLATLSERIFGTEGAASSQIFAFVPDLRTFPQLLAFLGNEIEYPEAA